MYKKLEGNEKYDADYELKDAKKMTREQPRRQLPLDGNLSGKGQRHRLTCQYLRVGSRQGAVEGEAPVVCVPARIVSRTTYLDTNEVKRR
jgi:hypothetical protein